MTLFNRITVIDTETTNLDANVAEICEVATAQFNGFEWVGQSSFYGTREPIPHKASAKNHISQRMLVGKPLFLEDQNASKGIMSYDTTDYYVAHNSFYDESVLKKAFNANQLVFDKKFICTMRLADKLYGDRMELRNLSYLRYFLELNVPDTVVAHRALDDVIVTACLFEQEVKDGLEAGLLGNTNDINKEIYDLCWAPQPITKFPFGKHKGELLKDIPTDYYIWAINNMDALNEKSELYDIDLAAAVAALLTERLEVS